MLVTGNNLVARDGICTGVGYVGMMQQDSWL